MVPAKDGTEGSDLHCSQIVFAPRVTAVHDPSTSFCILSIFLGELSCRLSRVFPCSLLRQFGQTVKPLHESRLIDLLDV